MNFDEWNRVMNKLTQDELKKLDLITNIDDSFGTPIAEESESMLTSRSTTIEENKSPEISDLSHLAPNFQALNTDSNVNNI